MALGRLETNFFRMALEMGGFPSRVHMLEIGESHLVPSETAEALLSIVAPHLPAERIAEARRRATSAAKSRSMYQKQFGPARAVHHAVFDPISYTAIDLEQGPRRYCLDLNGPVSLHQQFDCVINNGTSEHIFDQANVFRVIHDHTRPGGVMIHFTPSLGWANHGLFHAQPGFFFDLAMANGYEVVLVVLSGDGICYPLQAGDGFRAALIAHPVLANAEICALLRKTADTRFQTPVQGMWSHQSPGLTLATMPRRRTLQSRCNLAIGRPALQSSTSIWSWHDDPALDAAGGNNGQVTGYFGFCTELESEPWWMVDLDAVQPVTEVVVYNRLDGHEWAQRAAHLCVSFSNDNKSWRETYSRNEDHAFGGADGRPLRVETSGLTCRYVRVSLPGREFLHLDEIEVY
jgi:SAM-dependent methyltransferase